MSLENEIVDLKGKVEAMSDCAEATKDAYAQINELKEKVSALENTIKSRDTELSQSKTSYDELVDQTEVTKKMSKEEMMKKEEEIMKKQEEMKKAKSELDSALETVAAYKNKEEEMIKKEKKMKRMASLLEKGLDQTTSTSTVDKFESLEDDAFDAMIQLVEAAKKCATSAGESTPKASENEVEQALDNVEIAEELDLSACVDRNEEINTTRAALVDFVCARLGKKLNKGE